jgi:hypothetical protein
LFKRLRIRTDVRGQKLNFRRNDVRNCETGNRATDTAPTMTVMIAMTMATIGRLMKKLDTVVSSAFDERVDYPPGF